jgi:hypothetical protein
LKKTFRKAIAVLLAVLMVAFSAPLSALALDPSTDANRKWWVDDGYALADRENITAEPDYVGYDGEDPDSGDAFADMITDDLFGDYEGINLADLGETADRRANYKPTLAVIVSSQGVAGLTAAEYRNNYYNKYYGATKNRDYATCEAAGLIKNPAQLKAGDYIAVTVEMGGMDAMIGATVKGTFDTAYLQPAKFTGNPTNSTSTAPSATKWAAQTSATGAVIKNGSSYTNSKFTASGILNLDGAFNTNLMTAAAANASVNSMPWGQGADGRADMGVFGTYGTYFVTYSYEVLQDCDLKDVWHFNTTTAGTIAEPFERGTLVDIDGVSEGNDTLYNVTFCDDAHSFANWAVIWDNYSAGSPPVTTTHTVTYTRGGATVATLTVNDGTAIADLANETGYPANTANSQDAQYTYSYSWDYGTATTVTADMTVPEVCTQTTRTYDVTFTNYAGVDTVVSGVAYGTKPTAPANTAADAQYTYAWPTISNVDGTAATLAYQETRTTKTYDVTFTNYAGVDTVVNGVAYGATPTAPANTANDAQYTYAWPTISAVDGTAATTAYQETRTVNTYTVTFNPVSGAAITVDDVAYGTEISTIAPANSPSETTAAGTIVYMWDYAPGATVTGAVTIDEVTDPDASSVASYDVTFYNAAGVLVDTQSVKYGAKATAPANTANDAQYTYSWPTMETITGDTRYDEVKTVNTYTVAFVNYAGTTVQSDVLDYGTPITAPANTANDAYYTYSWPAVAATVTGDVTYTETRVGNTYDVTFTKADSTVVTLSDVAAGTDITSQIPANTAAASISDTQHNVYSWGDVATTVLADAAYTETATPGNHNFDSSVITKPATYEEAGIRTYTCSVCGATKTEEIPQLTGGVALKINATTMGTIALGKTDVTDGINTSVQRDSTIYLNATANAGAKFIGWAVNGKLVSPNAVYSMQINAATEITPTFTETKGDGSFTVAFVDQYGNVLKTQTVSSGSEIEAPAEPAITGCKFTGWDPAADTWASLTEGTTILAQFEKDTENFTYSVNADGCTIALSYKSAENTMSDIAYNELVTVSAPTATEWYANGSTTPVGYGSSYSFYIGSNITLTYGTASVAATPTVTALSTERLPNSHRIVFSATRTIPDGYTLVKAGYLYGKNADASELTLENVGNGVVKAGYCATNTEQFALQTGSASQTGTMRARAFIIYTDGSAQSTSYAVVQEYTY